MYEVRILHSSSNVIKRSTVRDLTHKVPAFTLVARSIKLDGRRKVIHRIDR
jgi:hypothetical protein